MRPFVSQIKADVDALKTQLCKQLMFFLKLMLLFFSQFNKYWSQSAPAEAWRSGRPRADEDGNLFHPRSKNTGSFD